MSARWGSLQAGLAYQAGQWDDAELLARRLLAVAPAGHAAYLLAWAHLVCGRVGLGRGQLDQALTDARAGLARAQAGGDGRYRQAALALTGRVLLATGDRDQAATVGARLLAELAAEPARGCATTDLGLLLVDLAHPPGAPPSAPPGAPPGMPPDEPPPGCPTGLPVGLPVGLPAGLPPTRWHAAVGALAGGDLPGALDRLAALGAHLDEAAVRLRLARQLAATGRPGEAAGHADQAAAVFRKAGAAAELHHAEALAEALLAATQPDPANRLEPAAEPAPGKHPDRPDHPDHSTSHRQGQPEETADDHPTPR